MTGGKAPGSSITRPVVKRDGTYGYRLSLTAVNGRLGHILRFLDYFRSGFFRVMPFLSAILCRE
jgi:hypothetical protein